MTFSLKRFALIYRVARATPCLVGFHSVPTTRGFFSHPTPAGFLLMGSTPTCPTNPCDSSGSVRLHATSFIRFRYWPVRVNGCCIVRRRSRPCNAADSPFSLSLSISSSLPPFLYLSICICPSLFFSQYLFLLLPPASCRRVPPFRLTWPLLTSESTRWRRARVSAWKIRSGSSCR